MRMLSPSGCSRTGFSEQKVQGNVTDIKSSKPSQQAVVAVLSMAAAAMAVAVYFGGNGHLPLAMTGTVLFVALGGIGFELARRRSS
jgi:hypothetical protein